METFFTFAQGRLESSQDFAELIRSIELPVDRKTLQIMITETAGLESSNFDNLALALSQLQEDQGEFVCKTVDMVICKSITDIKVRKIISMILIVR